MGAIPAAHLYHTKYREFPSPTLPPEIKWGKPGSSAGWPLVREKSGKYFLQGQGKVREFCKLVRQILNTKKVREKSGNFIILAQSMCCSRYFETCRFFKSVDFFS